VGGGEGDFGEEGDGDGGGGHRELRWGRDGEIGDRAF
jgi:hypothetical protein